MYNYISLSLSLSIYIYIYINEEITITEETTQSITTERLSKLYYAISGTGMGMDNQS